MGCGKTFVGEESVLPGLSKFSLPEGFTKRELFRFHNHAVLYIGFLTHGIMATIDEECRLNLWKCEEQYFTGFG